MPEENSKNKNKFNEKENSEDIAENLKAIKELEEELEERKKKKEKIFQAIRKVEEKKEYSFNKDPSQLFKRKKLKHFVSGGKGEKQMLKALTGGKIRGLKSKQREEFARGLRKFADESVKTSKKPTTLKKITMLNYLKQLKKEKRSPFKRSQIRKIRETICSGSRNILAGREVNKKSESQNETEKKFSISRRTDKSFEGRGRVRKY